MKIRVNIVYTFGNPPDGHEIWLEKVWEGIVPPLSGQKTLQFGCNHYEATFKISYTEWYPLEDEFYICLHPCIQPESEDKFWDLVKCFLNDSSWGYCEDNTAFKTIDRLKTIGLFRE